ncbi:hypothetical protein BDY21DRAFT_418747, partial [Lineolata rhizophorae]
MLQGNGRRFGLSRRRGAGGRASPRETVLSRNVGAAPCRSRDVEVHARHQPLAALPASWLAALGPSMHRAERHGRFFRPLPSASDRRPALAQSRRLCALCYKLPALLLRPSGNPNAEDPCGALPHHLIDSPRKISPTFPDNFAFLAAGAAPAYSLHPAGFFSISPDAWMSKYSLDWACAPPGPAVS